MSWQLCTLTHSCVVLHAEYVAVCIEHILSLYKGVKPHPQSVVIIGHSMVCPKLFSVVGEGEGRGRGGGLLVSMLINPNWQSIQ